MAKRSQRQRSEAAPARRSERTPRDPLRSVEPGHGAGRLGPVWRRLFEPVDIASLAVFRICFGLLMLWHILSYTLGGWIEVQYLAPTFFFKFQGFEWAQRLSPPLLTLHFWLLAVAALMIALGLYYRVACCVFALGWTYVFLLDEAQYQNHTYLLCLLSFLMIFVPAHRTLALDARRRRGLRSDSIPAWSLWLLRFQIAIPYVFGGLAKLNSDWLLRAQPMKIWLQQGADTGIHLPFLKTTWAAFALSWGGALYDLSIVPLLLWRRTRLLGVAMTLFFHLANSQLFTIGVFPWLMLAATGLFFSPDWPRRAGFPGLRRKVAVPAAPDLSLGRRRLTVGLLAAWAAVQLLLPMRHFLYPGNVDWTEIGHHFSWRMKLRDKRGDLHFVAVDPAAGKAYTLTSVESVLTRRQQEMMLHDPDMMRQFAVFLAGRLRATGYGTVEVRAVTSISFNGRKKQPLVDPKVDLSKAPPALTGATWIEPLRE